MVALFQSIRSSWQAASWWKENASSLSVPGCEGVPDSPGVGDSMNTGGGLEMEETFLLETWCADLGGDVERSPLPSCCQDLKARGFHQKCSSRRRSSGWALGALLQLLPLPGPGARAERQIPLWRAEGAAWGRAEGGGAGSSSIQRQSRGCALLPMEPEPRWQQRCP